LISADHNINGVLTSVASSVSAQSTVSFRNVGPASSLTVRLSPNPQGRKQAARVSLSRMIHLSNSRGHTQGAQPFTKRRADSPVARPSQPTLSDEVRSAGQPGAGSPRRLEPANRSVNRPKPAHKHQSRPTHRNGRTAIARSSHPDQLRSPTIPKTNKTADPPTSGPRRPVGEMGYRGHRIRRQS
jgi:hypothetical protein